MSKIIKTGGDPRTLPDYASLRDEMSKLTHPARPDVNWRYVEKLCLSLFEQNGVELQTVAWYTLARTQQAGLSGLNEGLEILERLINHQWSLFWPQQVHARIEIISNLSQRLQQRIRSLAIHYSDLRYLYQAEKHLGRIGEGLQRLELKHLSQIDALRTMLHNTAVRLENSDSIPASEEIVQPEIVLSEARDVQDNTVKWVYVAQPEQRLELDKVREPALVGKSTHLWKSFVAGMVTMLVISFAAVWGWQYFQRSDPLQEQFIASLSPLPTTLTSVQLETLRQHSPLPQALIAETWQQLVRLGRLSPDWNIDYGHQLVQQAQQLWPEQANELSQQWLRVMNANRISTENLHGWHQGMTQLQQLRDRLNGLDEKKGKYMTVSELKSVVFSVMQSFNQTIPTEEQLRILSQTPAGEPLPTASGTQLEIHLKQLIARYAEIKQRTSP